MNIEGCLIVLAVVGLRNLTIYFPALLSFSFMDQSPIAKSGRQSSVKFFEVSCKFLTSKNAVAFFDKNNFSYTSESSCKLYLTTY